MPSRQGLAGRWQSAGRIGCLTRKRAPLAPGHPAHPGRGHRPCHSATLPLVQPGSRAPGLRPPRPRRALAFCWPRTCRSAGQRSVRARETPCASRSRPKGQSLSPDREESPGRQAVGLLFQHPVRAGGQDARGHEVIAPGARSSLIAGPVLQKGEMPATTICRGLTAGARSRAMLVTKPLRVIAPPRVRGATGPSLAAAAMNLPLRRWSIPERALRPAFARAPGRHGRSPACQVSQDMACPFQPPISGGIRDAQYPAPLHPGSILHPCILIQKPRDVSIPSSPGSPAPCGCP